MTTEAILDLNLTEKCQHRELGCDEPQRTVPERASADLDGLALRRGVDSLLNLPCCELLVLCSGSNGNADKNGYVRDGAVFCTKGWRGESDPRAPYQEPRRVGMSSFFRSR